jgi:tetratricopeptide (TPR) repeat protein
MEALVRWRQGGRKGASDAEAPPLADSDRSEIDSNPAVDTGPDPEFVRLLGELGGRMVEAELISTAVGMCRLAVEESRRLAAVDPPRYRPALAGRLHVMAWAWCKAERMPDAVEAAAEAVTLYRTVDDTGPAGHRAGLAAALNRLGFMQHLDGATAQAIAPLGEAVRLYRAEASTSGIVVPDAAYAEALWNYGVVLWETGHADEALEVRIEVLEIYRALFAADPGYRSMYLLVADGLATSLENQGRTAESAAADAIVAAGQEVDRNRRLAAEDPASYRPALAVALNNVGNMLRETHRYDEAVERTAEAVKLFRVLAEDQPERFRSALAMSLANLASALTNAGRYGEALAPAEQSLARFAELAAESPEQYAADVDEARERVARLAALAPDAGVTAVEEAVARYRDLAATDPVTHREQHD